MSRLGSWDRKLWEDFSDVYTDKRRAIRVVHDVESPFGEFLTVQRTPVIELSSTYGFSELRDLKEELNGGSVGTSNAEFMLETGTTANGYARLDSAEIARYIPGYAGEMGIGVRIPSTPTGNKVARWGGYGQNENDGLYFGIDSTGYFVARLKDNVETKVYQENWNRDTLDGSNSVSNPSGYNINNANGHIFQIVYTWYGYGPIEYQLLVTLDNIPAVITCHQFAEFEETSIDSPNLRIFAEVDNGGDTEDYTIYVGGRQFSIVGNYNPKYRFTGNFRGSVSTSTTVLPLISFRRKTGFGNRSIKLEAYDAIASSQAHVIEIRIGGTLTGESWATPTNHTAAETALESDRSATAISGGLVVWQQLIPGGVGNQSILSDSSVDLDIPNGKIVTLCARTLSGTGSVRSAFRLREEW